jgi:hypothetical protein
VVTEFVLRLHPQRETVFGGLIGFPGTPELVKKIFDAAAVWAKTMTPKDGLMLILADPPGKPVAIPFFDISTTCINLSSPTAHAHGNRIPQWYRGGRS